MALAGERRAAGFVLGLPINMDGSEGPRAQATRAFARNLAKLTELPIALWDERLSTAAVERALIEADVSRDKRKAGDRPARRRLHPAGRARPACAYCRIKAARLKRDRALISACRQPAHARSRTYPSGSARCSSGRRCALDIVGAVERGVLPARRVRTKASVTAGGAVASSAAAAASVASLPTVMRALASLSKSFIGVEDSLAAPDERRGLARQVSEAARRPPRRGAARATRRGT